MTVTNSRLENIFGIWSCNRVGEIDGGADIIPLKLTIPVINPRAVVLIIPINIAARNLSARRIAIIISPLIETRV